MCFSLLPLQDDEDTNGKSHGEDDVKENNGEIENVRVVVRVRPMDQAEIDSGSANVVKVDKLNRCINVTKINASSSSAVSEPPKRYYFDNVFGEDSTQVCIRYVIVIQSIFRFFLFIYFLCGLFSSVLSYSLSLFLSLSLPLSSSLSQHARSLIESKRLFAFDRWT